MRVFRASSPLSALDGIADLDADPVRGRGVVIL
jgi:hypothetical protein